MSFQKYRADRPEKQSDNATRWYCDWIGGPTLSRIDNCRLENMAGDMRRTVYITGEPDTWFSQPAKCVIGNKTVNGFVTTESDTGDNLVFYHCYY